jgi:hypothetical protein
VTASFLLGIRPAHLCSSIKRVLFLNGDVGQKNDMIEVLTSGAFVIRAHYPLELKVCISDYCGLAYC